MELTDILIDLSNSKAALEVANQSIRKLRGKCFRKNILLVGLMWVSLSAYQTLNAVDKKRQESEARVRDLEATLAAAAVSDTKSKDVCCDGKATIDKKEV
nr:MAG TPA: hypothetical protein [Caudoviricetes sp.]